MCQNALTAGTAQRGIHLAEAVRFLFHGLRQAAFEQVRKGIAQGQEDVLLAGEIKIESALGRMRLADDVIHLGVVIALGGKHLHRRFEDAGAGFLGGVVGSGHKEFVDRLVGLRR